MAVLWLLVAVMLLPLLLYCHRGVVDVGGVIVVVTVVGVLFIIVAVAVAVVVSDLGCALARCAQSSLWSSIQMSVAGPQTRKARMSRCVVTGRLMVCWFSVIGCLRRSRALTGRRLFFVGIAVRTVDIFFCILYLHVLKLLKCYLYKCFLQVIPRLL